MITAANFETYVKENRLSASLYFYVHLVDDNGNNYYFTDAPTALPPYQPTQISVSPAYYEASLYSGIYSVRPISIEIQNVERYQANNTTKRISDNFASNEFETETATIYLGYYGITSTGDLFPYYAGKMMEYIYDVNRIRFNVVDQFIFDLPIIPKNKIDRATFANVSDDLLNKPIPIVYGRWNYMYSGTTHYGNKAFIPMFITTNNLDSATPDLVLECADHEVDAIDNVYIFDDVLGVIGDIQDDITNSLANARATVDLYTANARDLLRANHYLYANRTVENAGTTSNDDNMVDSDFDTEATLGDGSGTSGSVFVGFNETGQFSRDEMTPIYSTSGGTETVTIAGSRIEISMYVNGTLDASSSVNVVIGGSGAPWFTEVYSYTTANGWSDTDTFNVSTSDLVLTHNYLWDGAVGAFTLKENSASPTSYGIVPSAGYYTTMQELAEELDRQIAESAAANSYAVSYQKAINKIVIRRVSGALNFMASRVGTWSDDIGYSNAAPAYVTGTFTPDDPTLLSVPDGDFGLCKIAVTASTPTGGTLRVKGVRIRVTRSYRDYNRALGAGRGRFVRRSPGTNQRTRNRQTIINIDRGAGGGRTISTKVTDPDAIDSIRDKIAGSRFYAAVDGYPTGATYFKKGPEIIKSLLENYIGIASGNIDSTAFSTANTNATIELGLYVAEESDAVAVIADLAKFSKGFVHIGQDGKYKCSVIKSSYSGGDVNVTIQDRDIKSPLIDNLNFYRNSISEINSDLYFSYLYNWANNEYDETINKTTTSALNLQSTALSCVYCTDDDQASTIAEYFCGNGGTLGQFGELKTIVDVTLLAAEYHLLELGDIVQFSTDFDADIDAFGGTLSSIYFMVIGKQFGRKEIRLTLLEVG